MKDKVSKQDLVEARLWAKSWIDEYMALESQPNSNNLDMSMRASVIILAYHTEGIVSIHQRALIGNIL